MKVMKQTVMKQLAVGKVFMILHYFSNYIWRLQEIKGIFHLIQISKKYHSNLSKNLLILLLAGGRPLIMWN